MEQRFIPWLPGMQIDKISSYCKFDWTYCCALQPYIETCNNLKLLRKRIIWFKRFKSSMKLCLIFMKWAISVWKITVIFSRKEKFMSFIHYRNMKWIKIILLNVREEICFINHIMFICFHTKNTFTHNDLLAYIYQKIKRNSHPYIQPGFVKYNWKAAESCQV